MLSIIALVFKSNSFIKEAVRKISNRLIGKTDMSATLSLFRCAMGDAYKRRPSFEAAWALMRQSLLRMRVFLLAHTFSLILRRPEGPSRRINGRGKGK